MRRSAPIPGNDGMIDSGIVRVRKDDWLLSGFSRGGCPRSGCQFVPDRIDQRIVVGGRPRITPWAQAMRTGYVVHQALRAMAIHAGVQADLQQRSGAVRHGIRNVAICTTFRTALPDHCYFTFSFMTLSTFCGRAGFH